MAPASQPIKSAPWRTARERVSSRKPVLRFPVAATALMLLGLEIVSMYLLTNVVHARPPRRYCLQHRPIAKPEWVQKALKFPQHGLYLGYQHFRDSRWHLRKSREGRRLRSTMLQRPRLES